MNSNERWERIKIIYEGALSRTGGERRAYLEGACGGDADILREVESLLGSFDAKYLEGAAVEQVADTFGKKSELRPGTTVGHYKIVAEIGRGGQGSVYEAVDTKLDRTVALKTLPPELGIDETARKRFRREAQLASSLDHPNICAIHDLAEIDGVHFIVMQFVAGRNVRDLLCGKPLDLKNALRIGIQVCDALAAAHERGIIHRDIKAHNVMITGNGVAKVLDFGLAKVTSEGYDHTELTALGSPYGGETDGIRNLWKISVEPGTLRWTGTFERLTTGAGKDTEIAVSPDGTKLAFTTLAERTRVWSFPFDTAKHIQKGAGEPITPAGMDTGEFAMSADGKRLVFVAKRAGKLGLWEQTLEDNENRLLLTAADNDIFTSPRWSPDGTLIAFARNHNPDPDRRKFVQTFEKSIVLLPVDNGAERSLTTANVLQGWPWDWSQDGKYVLGSSALPTAKPEHWGLYLFPVEAAPESERQQKLVIDDPEYNFWQGKFSRDGRWILFLAARIEDGTDSFLGVVPASGGAVTQLVSGDFDKPRWSDDGKTIYFYSNRSGFRNVWGIGFDPAAGRARGEAFRTTNFDGPDRMLVGAPQIGQGSMITDLTIAQDRLIVNVTQVSGSVWILDNVDR